MSLRGRAVPEAVSLEVGDCFAALAMTWKEMGRLLCYVRADSGIIARMEPTLKTCATAQAAATCVTCTPVTA